MEATAAFVAELHHYIDALKVLRLFLPVRVNQVQYHDVLHLLTLTSLLRDVNQGQIVPSLKRR